MFDYIKNILTHPADNNTGNDSNTKKVQIATCALFLEVANADDNFDPREKQHIISVMEKTFNLSAEDVKELLQLANESMQNSVSIYEYTDVINRNFTYDEKYKILENLWRLVLVDNNLDKYEEYLLRKITNNLNLDHKDFIAAKLKVKEELNIKN